MDKKLPLNQMHTEEIDSTHLMDLKTPKDDYDENSFVFSRISKEPISFTLTEIENAIERSLHSDELKRFSNSRFSQVEYDLGESLSDLQQRNLLNGHKLEIENLICRKLSLEEIGKIRSR